MVDRYLQSTALFVDYDSTPGVSLTLSVGGQQTFTRHLTPTEAMLLLSALRHIGQVEIPGRFDMVVTHAGGPVLVTMKGHDWEDVHHLLRNQEALEIIGNIKTKLGVKIWEAGDGSMDVCRHAGDAILAADYGPVSAFLNIPVPTLTRILDSGEKHTWADKFGGRGELSFDQNSLIVRLGSPSHGLCALARLNDWPKLRSFLGH